MKLNITKERIVGLLAVPVLALTVGSAPAFAAINFVIGSFVNRE